MVLLLCRLINNSNMKIFLPLCFLFTVCFFSSSGQNQLVKQWDKRFGGTNSEVLYSFQQTTDGGYILGGPSLSSIGGDKSQGIQGSYDYWVVKIDSAGVKLWDKDFVGSSVDNLYTLEQT